MKGLRTVERDPLKKQGAPLSRHIEQIKPRFFTTGLPEDSRVETPAFTDAIRMYRQAKEQYGTWDMMCGSPVQPYCCLTPCTLHKPFFQIVLH
ncbi:UNVERIFIED_CONTAM: hypothetical protein FKN15_061831 [Acipenser sinensis]